MGLTALQKQTIRLALAEANRLGASAKVKKALIEAGYTESRWQPLDHGDRDSQGFLQQRPSQGWGTPAQVRDVRYATRQFVTRAQPIAHKYGTAGELAQAVQRSATPTYFGKVGGIASQVIRRYDNGRGGGSDGSTGSQEAAGAVVSTKTTSTPASVDEPGSALMLQILQGQMQRPTQYPSSGLKPPAFSATSNLHLAGQTPQASGAPVQQKMSLADQLAAIRQIQGSTLPDTGSSSQQTTVTPTGSGGAVSGGGGGTGGKAGKVSIAKGADRAGVSTNKRVFSFLDRVASYAGGNITVTTGTNHNRLTVNGNVSDHWSGNAADIAVPVDSHRGDIIATSALIAAGVPKDQARKMAQRGGLYTLTHGGQRIQVIWKTYQGGNHHNHVHVGVRPA